MQVGLADAQDERVRIERDPVGEGRRGFLEPARGAQLIAQFQEGLGKRRLAACGLPQHVQGVFAAPDIEQRPAEQGLDVGVAAELSRPLQRRDGVFGAVLHQERRATDLAGGDIVRVRLEDPGRQAHRLVQSARQQGQVRLFQRFADRARPLREG